MPLNILVFGGTGEARQLAARLHNTGHKVISSLAGRTEAPASLSGETRVGHFGGPDRIAHFINDRNVDLLVDATHPYAGRISASISKAAAIANTPLLQLVRPAWERPDGAEWISVRTITDLLPMVTGDTRLLVTLGAGALEWLNPLPACHMLLRMIEPPHPTPAGIEILISRPPFTLAAECGLMKDNTITHLLTKNAGGDQTRAKIDAAATLGIPAFVVARPPLPDCPLRADNVGAALELIHRTFV